MHGLHQVRARDPSDPIIAKAGAAPEEGPLRVWAYALVLVVLAFPFYSPDVFWHLSSGRWIWRHGAPPLIEPFSFTRAGAPWIDFEWLTQLVWYAVESAAGLWGLWVLKIALLLATLASVDGLLRDKRAAPLARAAAAAFWAAATLAQADVRADLVSVIFFAILLRRLEARRGSFLFGFGLFALWGNLHAGFVFGWLLYALFAARARLEKRALGGLAAETCGAVLGSLMNPYGFAVFSVLFAHAAQRSMTHRVMEWRPPSWHSSFQIPLLAVLCVAPVAAWLTRRRAPPALLAAALATAAAAAFSARFGSFFGVAGAAFVFSVFPKPRARIVAAGLALLTPLIVYPFRQIRWDYPFHPTYVARRAVEFLVREKETLGPLRLFNQYEWGGYLGWRMGEDYRVFGDGRYLFAWQLDDAEEALSAPSRLEKFAALHRLDGFLIKNYDTRYMSERVYPDGARKKFARPWYVMFFPRRRWVLAYWDDQALLFLERARLPRAWTAAHEYRWRHPDDDAAFADALSRGEIPRAALAAEDARHAAEIGR